MSRLNISKGARWASNAIFALIIEFVSWAWLQLPEREYCNVEFSSRCLLVDATGILEFELGVEVKVEADDASVEVVRGSWIQPKNIISVCCCKVSTLEHRPVFKRHGGVLNYIQGHPLYGVIVVCVDVDFALGDIVSLNLDVKNKIFARCLIDVKTLEEGNQVNIGFILLIQQLQVLQKILSPVAITIGDVHD